MYIINHIKCYSSVSDNFDVTVVFAPTDAYVDEFGNIRWLTTSFFVTSCEIDVTKFPLDTQVCPVPIGSRTSSDEFIILSVGQHIPVMHNTSYTPNGEWALLEAPGISKMIEVPYSTEHFYEVTYYLKLQRKPLFYLYNLLFPALLVIIIGCLVFMVPPQSGEKVSLSITALLTMMVFLLVIMDYIPETSQTVPLLGM